MTNRQKVLSQSHLGGARSQRIQAERERRKCGVCEEEFWVQSARSRERNCLEHRSGTFAHPRGSKETQRRNRLMREI